MLQASYLTKGRKLNSSTKSNDIQDLYDKANMNPPDFDNISIDAPSTWGLPDYFHVVLGGFSNRQLRLLFVKVHAGGWFSKFSPGSEQIFIYPMEKSPQFLQGFVPRPDYCGSFVASSRNLVLQDGFLGPMLPEEYFAFMGSPLPDLFPSHMDLDAILALLSENFNEKDLIQLAGSSMCTGVAAAVLLAALLASPRI